MMGGVSGGGDDDVVQIQQPNKPGDPFIITVNCPDKTGLACDICRIILDFGLCITKGGLSLSLNSSFTDPIPFYSYLNLMDLLLNIIQMFQPMECGVTLCYGLFHTPSCFLSLVLI